MHIRRIFGSMVPEVVILLSCICRYICSKASGGVSLSPRPCSAKASTMLSLAPILPSVSISYRVHAHATSVRDTPAVVFRSCLFSRLLFEFTRRVRIFHTATIMVSFFQVPDARRIRSFFTKLPLATRLLLLLFTAFYLAKAFRPELEQWGALIPQEINLGTRESCNGPQYVGATNPRSAQSTD
jgi:hypothetical protein